MAKDDTLHIEPALRPLLAPGERLLTAAMLIKDVGTTEDVSISDELKNLLDPTILLGLGTHPGNLLQQAAFGRAVIGPADSPAGRLHAAVEATFAPTLAVTDDRLLVANLGSVDRVGGSWTDRWFGPVEYVATLTHESPRDAIVGAIMAPAGVLRRGRFLVVFTDGSVCALIGGPPKAGRRAAEAIGPPRPAAGTPGEEQA
ncbi:hypothetical protein [Micromonospora sp. NBC_01796]|uniref:hypothetical protein n=1 Tax=Micromonospora sp. NBC_01796 TaxID=2975987 RepID=UPI002DDA59CB|nr:hypothetical protein [Micromonospora sp. NBC_01796]WSA88179.1 hypothetical protein OIE47_11495 [Micromonospora sp. NBC_01796]